MHVAFRVTALLLLCSGVVLAVFERSAFGRLGAPLSSGGAVAADIAGAAIVALAAFCWLERDRSGPAARRLALVLALFLALVSAAVTVAIWGGVLSPWAWSVVVLAVALFAVHGSIVVGRLEKRLRKEAS